MARSLISSRVVTSNRALIGDRQRVPIVSSFNIADDFNRANGAIGSTSVGNVPWEVLTGTWTVASGKGKQTAAVGDCACVVDLGHWNATIEVFITVPGSTDNGGLVLRATDANNWLRLSIGEPNAFNLIMRSGGVNTTLATTAPSVTQGNSYLIRAVLTDSLITCSISGAGGGSLTHRIKHQLTPANYALFGRDKTKVGLWNSNRPNSLYDTFSASFSNVRTATP